MSARGSIERLRSGRFSARMSDRTRLGTYDTEAEARSMLDAAIAELESGPRPPQIRASRSFATTGTKWLDERELAGSRDIATDRSRWEQYIGQGAVLRVAAQANHAGRVLRVAAGRSGSRRYGTRTTTRATASGSRSIPSTVSSPLASVFMQDATKQGVGCVNNPFRLAGKPKKKQARTEDPVDIPGAGRAERRCSERRSRRPRREDRRGAHAHRLAPTSEAGVDAALVDVHLDAPSTPRATKTPYVNVRLSRRWQGTQEQPPVSPGT